MTKRALEKINEMKNKGGITWLLFQLTNAYKYKQEEYVKEYRHKIRGYLMALHDVGILTTTDVKALYLYYNEYCKKLPWEEVK